MTVLSAGLLSLLDEDELRGVIEHERAHATQRHHIVLMLFRAWKSSLPWFPIAHRAHHEVGLLIEMLTDDRARRSVDKRSIARAIALVSVSEHAPPQHHVDGIWMAPRSPSKARPRILRLDTVPLPTAQRAVFISVAVALIMVPTFLLFGPGIDRLLG